MGIGSFRAGGTTIDTLFEQLDTSDYAIFVLTPDDLTHSRGNEWFAPRDNVVLELGLFLGRLGRFHTFIVHPRHSTIKLPTDLAGVTAILYDDKRFAERGGEAAAVSTAATTIRRRIRSPQQKELDFIRAYIRFIAPETQLTDSYSTILTNQYTTICAEVENLSRRGDWRSLIEVKQRLREYFEYSGRYAEGVQFGRRYLSALEALGNRSEALWTRVKHVGYLLILDGQHAAGRKEIENVVSDTSASERPDHELLFYAYKYLSDSYLRDSMGDLNRSHEMLNLAEKALRSFPRSATKRKELEARLATNRGNLALVGGDPAAALNRYASALKVFTALGDAEHIGIAELKIAEAGVAADDRGVDVEAHLSAAESICLRIGWIEGHARVMEQRARWTIAAADKAKSPPQRLKMYREGLAHARRSQAQFDRMRSSEGSARMGALIAQLQRQIASAAARRSRIKAERNLTDEKRRSG